MKSKSPLRASQRSTNESKKSTFHYPNNNEQLKLTLMPVDQTSKHTEQSSIDEFRRILADSVLDDKQKGFGPIQEEMADAMIALKIEQDDEETKKSLSAKREQRTSAANSKTMSVSKQEGRFLQRVQS